ncbi:TlpA disulfide reductase family protein [Chitinophaga sancti]|uniref:peroxiredoxin family protein n=1 Tax=Chitinophaga sancti TaxID=1004 RepID=UPI002A75C8A1|nr:TlpA disulfide reductase family protein [Chitinophaga sancti]WPQ60235.1 TlpA disulfide reductase family protein [Chitinophaga sancti]
MKKILLCSAVLGIALAGFAQTAAPTPTKEVKYENPAADSRGYLVKVGDHAPDDFELVLTDGKKTTLKELRGKVVVLQFTASWCSVCRKEMPHLESEVWQANKNKDFVLIGVDRDEPLEKVSKFHEDMSISYPLALDPGAAIFRRYADKNAGVTRNIVIDRTGKIIYLTRLYDEKEFAAMLSVINEQLSH